MADGIIPLNMSKAISINVEFGISGGTTAITAYRENDIVYVQGYSTVTIPGGSIVLKGLPTPRTLNDRFICLDDSLTIHIMYFEQVLNSTNIKVSSIGGPLTGIQFSISYIAA